jgi:hypothetical protein
MHDACRLVERRRVLAGIAGSPPIYTLTPDAARAVLAGAQKSGAISLPEASLENRVVMVGPDGRTGIRVVRPAGRPVRCRSSSTSTAAAGRRTTGWFASSRSAPMPSSWRST